MTVRNFLHKLQTLYVFDLRAFALWRIAFALLILTDLAIRLSDLEAFYTNTGVLPVSALNLYFHDSLHFSLHSLGGSMAFEVFLFALNAVAAIFLLVGYRTRPATIICWLLMCSLHNRNPMILQCGDDLLRLGLFWAIFLPWGTWYSVDGAGKEKPRVYTGLPAIALMLQVACVYFFSGLEKSSAEWHSEGSALYYALSLDQLVLPPGKWLYAYPGLLRFLTHLTVYTEIIVPAFYFILWKNDAGRFIAITVFIIMHLVICSILFVGLFSLIGIAIQLALLPHFVMDKLDRNSLLTDHTPAVHVPRWMSFTCLLLITYTVIWNAGNAPQSSYTLHHHLRGPGRLLRLEQNWGVFAPGVFKDDGWYVLPGKTKDGDSLDLYRNGAPVSYSKPGNVVGEIKNDRWRKYGEHLMLIRNEWMRGYYCNFMKRKWNEDHPQQQIDTLEVVYMMELTGKDYAPVVPTREVLWKCYE